MEYYQLRYKPTGNIFVLPKDVAVDTLKNDRGNYEILDKDFVDEQPTKPEEKGIYNKVVEQEEVKEQPNPKKRLKRNNDTKIY